jgi:RPA family protein
MSQSEEVNRREVAYRLFAAEFEDADFSYAESDEERAPNYVVTPTGARVNRLFVVGVLTEVEQVNEDVVRARVVDPTGAFVIYAGQYQPEALAALESADTPSFVAVTGKARTFQPDDSDVVYTSIRPEEVSEVDADTRDRWVVTTAEQTVDRVATMAAAHQRVERDDRLRQVLESAGVREGLAAGIPLALDHYETTPDYLDAVRTLAIDAARVVAGDQEEVGELALSPSDGGDAPLDFAADLDVPSDAGEVEPTEAEPEADTGDEEFDGESGGEAEPEAEGESEAEAEAGAEVESESDAEAEADAEANAEPGTELEPTERQPSPEPAAETPSPDEVAAEAKPDSESEVADADEVAEPASGGDEAESEAAAGDGEMYEMSEEERQEVEENFDVGFSSGDEIPEAGESDIDAPEPADESAPGDAETDTADEDELGDFDAGDSGADSASEDVDAEASSESADQDEEPEDETSEEFTEDEYDEPESEAEDEDAGSMDLDLEDYVVDLMSELDGGDGARREEVVATAADERDADEGEIEDAIQDALMSGRCYESGDDHLKAI